MFASLLLASALAVSPSDRMAMADRLFNRGEHAAARGEYAALEGEKAISADEIVFRLAECDYALGDRKSARVRYDRLLKDFPNSRHADRALLMRALSSEGEDRVRDLKLLDTDSTAPARRAVALYHLGEARGDADAYARCVKLDPKGPYAPYATLRRAAILCKDKDAAVRREGTSLLLEIAFGNRPEFAEEALYLAGATSFSERRYGESVSLFARYLRRYPKGAHVAAATDCCAWSCYLTGKYAQAVRLCEGGKSEDAAYLRAAASQFTGDKARAKALLAKYLEDYPQGRYRRDAELPLARLQFEQADAAGDAGASIEAAKRATELSGVAADRLRLAWAYEKNARAEDADREYLEIARRHPGTPEAAEASYRRAMNLLRAEKWSAAEVALGEALAGKLEDRKRPEALYWRGMASGRIGHAEEGAALLKEALKGGLSLDQSREARLALADLDFNAGRREAAVAAYETLVREGAAERMSAAKALAVGRTLKPAEAKICAATLVKSKSPEWRQAGYALLGDAESALGNLAASADAYRKCLAESCVTEAVAPAALHLGQYLVSVGRHEEAEATLKRAIQLASDDAQSRAAAYLALAKSALARKDCEAAKGYATVVTALFEKSAEAAEATALLKQAGEAK